MHGRSYSARSDLGAHDGGWRELCCFEKRVDGRCLVLLGRASERKLHVARGGAQVGVLPQVAHGGVH